MRRYRVPAILFFLIAFLTIFLSNGSLTKRLDARDIHKPSPVVPVKEPVPEKVVCPPNLSLPPPNQRANAYEGAPYQPGEISEFEVRYMTALAGTATIEVRPPVRNQLSNGSMHWLRSYHVEALTGEWYKMIFVAHDRVDAIVRPWDFAISRFYIEQDEGQIFGRRFQQQKWLEFSQEECKVHERTKKTGKPEKIETFDLVHGAKDTLGIVFWMREQKYQVGQKIRTMVYSSEKNWWLEADPIAVETVQTKAGTFDAMKMKLQTYIGKELQQKGDVYVWIDTKSPQRPLVLIKGEISLGSVWIELSKYIPGK